MNGREGTAFAYVRIAMSKCRRVNRNRNLPLTNNAVTVVAKITN